MTPRHSDIVDSRLRESVERLEHATAALARKLAERARSKATDIAVAVPSAVRPADPTLLNRGRRRSTTNRDAISTQLEERTAQTAASRIWAQISSPWRLVAAWLGRKRQA